MLESYTRQIMNLKEKIRSRQKLQHLLDRTLFFYSQEKERFDILTTSLDRMDQDLEELDKMSVTGLFLTLLKDKNNQQRVEYQKILATKLIYDECSDSIETVELEIEFLKFRTLEFGDMHANSHMLLEMMAKKLSAIPSEEVMDLELFIKTIEEVACSGNAVLTSLDAAHKCLAQVKDWGSWTLSEEGSVPVLQKYNNIDESRDYMNQARQLLRRFHQEVDELQSNFDDSILISNRINTELNYDAFIKDILEDWTNCTGIRESIKYIENLQENVHSAMNELEIILQEAKTRYETIVEK